MFTKSSAALIAVFALGALLAPAAAATAPAPFMVADIPPPKEPTPDPGPGPDPSAPAQDPAAAEDVMKNFTLRTGIVELPGGQAKVTIAEGFAYLDTADTRKLLVDVWGNPPALAADVLGAIIPAGVSVVDEKSWAAILTYENDGHVADDDANSIDYNDLLKQIQDQTAVENDKRVKQGYEPISVVGWAQSPSYDAKEHKLYWAKHVRFGTNGETLNYAIRALGRTGVLQVNVVADMKLLPEINAKIPALLSMVSFNEGNRYADFDESTDQVAAYGLAALVAGGVAAKAGLLKGLLVFLAAFWKIIAVGILAVGAGLYRFAAGLFGRKPGPTAPPGS